MGGSGADRAATAERTAETQGTSAALEFLHDRVAHIAVVASLVENPWRTLHVDLPRSQRRRAKIFVTGDAKWVSHQESGEGLGVEAWA